MIKRIKALVKETWRFYEDVCAKELAAKIGR